MYTYKILMRRAEPVGTLEMFEDRCEAKNRDEADRIFAERHGRGFVVSGPTRVREGE